MAIEDPFEMFVEALNRQAPQAMEDMPDLNPTIGVGIAPVLRSDQQALIRVAQLPQLSYVEVPVAQHDACLGRDATQLLCRNHTIRLVRRRQFCSQRNPDTSHSRSDVQLPAIDPPMPTRFGPMRLGSNGRMRHDSGCTVEK